MHSFTTKHLLIRPLNEQDKDLFCSLYTDAKTMRYIEAPYSQEKAITIFNGAVKRNQRQCEKFKTWAVLSDTSDRHTSKAQTPIGIVMLYNELYQQALSTTEIGILLLQEAQGKSWASEALAATLTYGFNYLALDKINARFYKKNLATKKMVKKVGFVTDLNNKADNTEMTIESITKAQLKYLTKINVPMYFTQE